MSVATLAIVGCGNPSQQWHLPTMAELAKRGAVEFAAVCDLDPALAEKTGQKYGVPHYSNIEDMLAKEPAIQAVDIVTGDPTHHGLATLIADHGKHVMVEKPMAMTLSCCDAIVDACQRNGVHFEVAENYFRQPKERMILKLIHEGVLGDILRVHFVEPYGNAPYEPSVTPKGFTRPVSHFASYSGVCMDMGAHRLSQLRLYANSEVRQITGTIRKYRSDPKAVHEDWAHAMVDFESGAVGIYETSKMGEETVRFSQITGTKGRILDYDYRGPDIPLRLRVGDEMQDIAVEYERHTVDGVDVTKRIIAHTDTPIVWENPFSDYAINDWNVGHASEIMSLANAAADGTPPEYGVEGRKDVEMVMAIYESSLQNMAPIQLPITGERPYEAMLHADYEEKFGKPLVA
ncbi:MAG: Gfo/Idh/MocA family oxidoreductase [Pseudomonadota bacterium]